MYEPEDGMLRFGQLFDQAATPFKWDFTRADLERLLAKQDKIRQISSIMALNRKVA